MSSSTAASRMEGAPACPVFLLAFDTAGSLALGAILAVVSAWQLLVHAASIDQVTRRSHDHCGAGFWYLTISDIINSLHLRLASPWQQGSSINQCVAVPVHGLSHIDSHFCLVSNSDEWCLNLFSTSILRLIHSHAACLMLLSQRAQAGTCLVFLMIYSH